LAKGYTANSHPTLCNGIATTGEEIWGPSEPYTRAFGSYALAGTTLIAYGKLIGGDFDGMVHAYDLKTGEHLWDFNTPNMGLETVYGNTPIMSISAADGKVYVSTGHTHLKPLYRGSNLHCLNATTGEEIWKISNFGMMTPAAIAEGYLITPNAYDNQIYCIGKGPSATTVTASPKIIAKGNSVMIEGTVTDLSPGTKDLEVIAKSSNAEGVPAIADEYQEEWMEYLYMQQPMPQDAKGVEVVLTTLDPNSNTYEIGRTTSSDRGTFGCEVDLPVPGLYKIIATFEGSDSYYGSSAETYVSVEEAESAAQPIEPEEPTEPEPTEPEPTEPEPTEPEPTEPEPTEPAEAPLFSTTDLAIIAAVAVAVVIGVAAYWTLRKRK
jgi:hypothetical protein